MMRNFLVIDDNSDRLSAYKKLFDFVNLEYAANSDEVREKIKKYDGYLIDIVYDEPCYSGLTFKVVVDLLPEDKPVFIISNRWQEAMDGSKMQSLVQSSKYKNVLGYLSWEKISNGDTNEIVKDFIITQFNNYYDLAYEAFEPNDSITILQLSDIEFGNPAQTEYSETSTGILISNVRKDLKKIGNNSKKVDFIVICGDIAFKGRKSEYDKAKEWLEKLGNNLLVNNDNSRFIIAPGNHDFNFDAAVGNHYQYVQKRQDSGNIDRKYEVREDVVHDYDERAFYDFGKFIYELTGNPSVIMEPYKPIINRKYENYGFNFISLNPVRMKSDLKFDYGLNDSYVASVIDSFNSDDLDSVINIILSHVHYGKYSVTDNTSDAVAPYIEKLVSESKSRVWLYGHAHSGAIIDDITIGEHKVLVSRSNSVMLDSRGRCENADNGYTLLNFIRENNKVIKVEYLDKDNSVKYKTSPFEQ